MHFFFLTKIHSVQAYPVQRNLQEQPSIKNDWDKEVEVGLKLALFRINFNISKSFIILTTEVGIGGLTNADIGCRVLSDSTFRSFAPDSEFSKHSEFTPKFVAHRLGHHFCSLNGLKILFRS